MSDTNGKNNASVDCEAVLEAETEKIRLRRRRIYVNHLESKYCEFNSTSLTKSIKDTLNKHLNALRSTVEKRDVPDAWDQFAENVCEIANATKDEKESLKIARWAGRIKALRYEDTTPITSTNGLALSGGGIRSAAFNLGVLQALDRTNKFEDFDYMSTVSGGGYIGSSLTWFLHHYPRKEFPFRRDTCEDTTKHRLEYLRRYASYLTPGEGLGQAALFAAVARGITMNLLVLLPLLIAFFIILTSGLSNDWGLKLLCQLKQHPWITALLMLISALFVWSNRLIADKNPLECNRVTVLRIVFWIGLLAIIFVTAPVLHGIWTNHFDVYLAWLPLVAIGVVLTANLTPKNNLGPLGIEFIEISSWSVVFWLVYLIVQKVTLESNSAIVSAYPAAFVLLLMAAIIFFSKLLVNFLFYTVLSTTNARLKFHRHRLYSVQYGDLLIFGSISGFLGLVPLIDYVLFCNEWIGQAWEKFLATASISGVISTVIGWVFRTPTNEKRGVVSFFLRLGLTLLIISGVLVGYRVAIYWTSSGTTLPGWLYFAWFSLYLVLINADINYVSMHRFYRNRLKEAFIFGPCLKTDTQLPTASNSDNLDLNDIDIAKTGAPYHLINTNLVTVGSRDGRLRLRGGDSFIFSPLYIGSNKTQYASTSKSPFLAMSIATALAISGAAVDPNTGSTRSWALRIIMTWLNVRLGYWCAHPDPKVRWTNSFGRLVQSSWLFLITKEMFGHPREDWRYIRLSDGGHFDNLGLYELVRRRCQFIVVSDAGADPDYEFSDLATAIERVRTDMNVDIEIQLTNVMPKPTTSGGNEKSNERRSRISAKPYALGTIHYPNENGKNQNGVLVFIKSTLFNGLPQDVMGYARKNDTFPDQTTADQFFDEEQFEAYRELGYRSTMKTIEDLEPHITPHMLAFPN